MAAAINSVVKKLSNPTNTIAVLVAVGILILLGIVIVQRLKPVGESSITENQIKIQKGNRVVIVDKNGLVEYRTDKGVFYEVWDSSQITSFFTSIEEKAKKYLENPNPQVCETGYTVTLYFENKLVEICLENDEQLDEIYQQFGDGNDTSVADLFDDFFDDGSGTTPSLTATPTPVPTTLIVSGGEGGEAGGSGGNNKVVQCELFEQLVTSRTVISNTVCVLEVTPTLPPLP